MDIKILHLQSHQLKQWTAQVDMIHEESFGYDSFETDTLSTQIRASDECKSINYLLAVRSDYLLSMLTYCIFPDYKIEVTNLCTSRTERRRGYAKLLLEGLQGLYPRYRLIGTVGAERKAAMKLYRKLRANIVDDPNDSTQRLVEGPVYAKYQRTFTGWLQDLKSLFHKIVK
jgi:hypothetical protein